jgi:membrane associated rhomboid family serine protease
MREITPVVKQLLIINIIFYIGSQMVSDEAYKLFSLYYFENQNFRFWQPLTHMFMHAKMPEFRHILFNMLALYSFGSALEHYWGGKKFLFFYISCGLGAAFFHTGINYFEIQNVLSAASDLNLSSETLKQIMSLPVSDNSIYRPDLFSKGLELILNDLGKLRLVNQNSFDALYSAAQNSQIPMVGASGAIYGLLVAYAFMFPNAELAMMLIPIPIKAKYFVVGILFMDLYLGVSGKSIFGGSSGIAHFAHIGGALVGFIMMWYWKKNSFNDRRWN